GGGKGGGEGKAKRGGWSQSQSADQAERLQNGLQRNRELPDDPSPATSMPAETAGDDPAVFFERIASITEPRSSCFERISIASDRIPASRSPAASSAGLTADYISPRPIL